jgi:hypothetical protein
MTDADKFVNGEKIKLSNGHSCWWDRRLQAIITEQFDETKGENVLAVVYRVSEEKAREHSGKVERATAKDAE